MLKRKMIRGFTIVELLVVIVIIGILAAISFVSYSGINERAIGARIASDLNTNSKLLELYKIEHEEYPRTINTETNCPETPEIDNEYCLKVSEDDDTLTYEGDGGTGGGADDSYTLTITDETSNVSYQIVPSGIAIAVDTGSSGAVGSTFVNAWGGIEGDYAYSVIKTTDGGFIMAGYTDSYVAVNSDAFIAKYTSDGALSWSKTWGGSDSEQINSIIQTSDSGFAVAGSSSSFGDEYGDAFVAKYTSDGTLSWDTTWAGTNADGAYSIAETSDDGFVITGTTNSYGAGYGDAFIAKYTSDGTLSWDKTWGGTGNEEAESITQTSDGGFAISGETSSYGAGYGDAFIAKYTSDGTLSWDKTWGGENWDCANSITQTSDGGFAIAGMTTSYGAGSDDAFIAKYTSDGTLSWDKTWGGDDYDYAHSIAQTSDGGFIVAGINQSFGAVGSDAYIAKYASDGTLSWDRTWGGDDWDEAESVTQTSDGSYVMVGYTESYGSGYYDAFIAKYDPYGNIDGCPASMCKDPSASTSSPTASVSDPNASVSDPNASVSDPNASVSSPNATTTQIAPVIPPPAMTVTFSAQELYIDWPGDSQTFCKEWTTPPGKMIKGFMVSQKTEEDYDFFIVSSDGVEKYNKSGYITDEYVNISATPGTTLSACMSADDSSQDGYGGQVTGVLYD